MGRILLPKSLCHEIMVPFLGPLLLLYSVQLGSTEQYNLLTDGNLRLVGGRNPLEGRLEVLYMGLWGTICDDYWEYWQEGTVACRQMGFSSGEDFSGTRKALPTDVPILLDDVLCTGSEDRLTDCYHRGWNVNDCTHVEDVYLQCRGHYDDVRLVGSMTLNEGRVEVFQNGRWGTVCDLDSSWNYDSSDVVCRQLGYTRALGSAASFQFGLYSSEIAIRHKYCNGNERSLMECMNTNDTTGCGHMADVAVICDTAPYQTDNSSYTIWSVTELCLILIVVICTTLPVVVMVVRRVKTRRRHREISHISGSGGFENPNYLSTPADISGFQPTGYPAMPPSYEEAQLDHEEETQSNTADLPTSPQGILISSTPPISNRVTLSDEDDKVEEGDSVTYRQRSLADDPQSYMPPPYSPPGDPTFG